MEPPVHARPAGGDGGSRPVSNVLVTGCAGFIGSRLTEALLSAGVDVVGVDCFNDNYGRREKLANLELALNDTIDLIAEFSQKPIDVNYVATQAGDFRHTGADTAMALRNLGFAASTDLRTGLLDEFERVVDDERRLRNRSGRAARGRGADLRDSTSGRDWTLGPVASAGEHERRPRVSTS